MTAKELDKLLSRFLKILQKKMGKSTNRVHSRQFKEASSATFLRSYLSIFDLDDSVKVPSASNIQNAVTSVSSSYPSASNAVEAIFAGANISSVLDCTFQIMTGPVNIVNKAALKRPRRHIIESGDED